jgi:hypothetical protein
MVTTRTTTIIFIWAFKDLGRARLPEIHVLTVRGVGIVNFQG